MNNRENIWMMQNKFVLLQSYKLIAMERLRYKQSGKGIGHILDVITIARPWSLRLRRVPADPVNKINS